MAVAEKIQGRRNVIFVCCTPFEFCKGKQAKAKEKFRTHGSNEQVLACKRNYLLAQGFTQLSKREFINPVSGCIQVISKKAQRAKPGKVDYMIGSHGHKIIG